MTRCFADTFFYLAFTNERDDALTGDRHFEQAGLRRLLEA